MGALPLCWCLGVILLLPNLDARNVKLVPAETKTITTNGATHEISRYILVPDDHNNANAARTIADTIRRQIAANKGVNGAQSETNIKSDDIKDIKEYKVRTHDDKETKFDNVHDLIKTIHILQAEHDRNSDNIKSEVPASVKYHHYTGSHNKNHENHSNHDNSEVIGNWHKIKNDGKGVVEHTRVILNFKPQHKVAESKVIYIKHNKEGKDETNLKQGGLKMHFKGQNVQVASRGGPDINEDENTAKVNNLSKITKIKYSELPIKDLIKSGGKGDLTSIGINKTFTIPGKRGRFKLLHEHDDYDDVVHEKHIIQHYPLPKHKTVTHYYTSKYTVGRTVHGKDDKDDLSIRSHKTEANRGAAVAHETHLEKNNNLNIGLLRLNSGHGKSDLYKNIHHDENNDGEITIHKSSAPDAINVKKSNSIYTHSGVVNLQAKVLPEHEENTLLLNKNHAIQRKQNVHLNTNLSDEVAHDDEILSLSAENGDDNLSYRDSISPSAITKTHHSQTEHEIIDASHDKQSLEDTGPEKSLEVAINDVLIENRNKVDETEPTANDKIKYNRDYLQRDPNAIVFPQDSEESYEVHDTENTNTITTTDTPDVSTLSNSSEHDIKKSSIENVNLATSKEHSTEEDSLANESDKDVSQSNSNENSMEDNILSIESYETHDTGTENVNTNTSDTPEEETSLSDNSEELPESTTATVMEKSNNNLRTEPSKSVENEDLKKEDGNGSTEELGTTPSPSTVPINKDSNISDEAEEPQIDDATEPSSEVQYNNDNNTVPDNDSEVVSTVKTVPISDETDGISASQEKLDDVAELSTEELSIEEKPVVQETSPNEAETNISVETEKPEKSESKSDESVSKEITQEVPELSTETPVLENENKLEDTTETVPAENESSVSNESKKPGVDDVTEYSSETTENMHVPTTENALVNTAEPIPVSDEAHANDESEELENEEEKSNEIVKNVTKEDTVEIIPEVDDKSVDDKSDEPEKDDTADSSSEVLGNIDEDNVSKTDDVDDKVEDVPTAEETSASNETVVPEDEHTEEDENKFISAESEEVNPKDVSGSEPVTSDESVIDLPSSKDEIMIISKVDGNNDEIPNTISTEPSIADDNADSTAQPIPEEKYDTTTDEPLTPEHPDSSEISTESDQQELTSDEIAQLENLHKQYREKTEATDSPNIPEQESQNDYINFEQDSPSEEISGEIKEPKHKDLSQEIPEPEMSNDYDTSGYEVMQPDANDNTEDNKESSESYPPELSDKEASREEHENTHPTVNVHLTRFPITNQQASVYPTTYQNTIAYPNLPNSPNTNSYQRYPYENSDQYLQFLLGYLTSANIMQQLRQKYALGYDDMDKVRQTHIINILQGLGVHRISQENYLQLAQKIKQLEDVQKDIPKAEIDDQPDNQIPNQYYYMPYANVYPSVQTPKLSNAIIQKHFFQNVDAEASKTAAKALSDRVLSIVVYLRRLGIPEYRILQFVTEVKKHLTPAAIQSFMNDCKNKVFIGLREKIDFLAKQAMQRRCLKCRPAVYALRQNY